MKFFLMFVLGLDLHTACAMERDGADHARQHATVLAKLLCCFRCCLRQHPHEREVVHVSEPAIPAVSNAVPLSPAGSASAAAAAPSSVIPEHMTYSSPDGNKVLIVNKTGDENNHNVRYAVCMQTDDRCIEFGRTALLPTVAWSPNSRFLLLDNGNTLHLYDTIIDQKIVVCGNDGLNHWENIRWAPDNHAFFATKNARCVKFTMKKVFFGPLRVERNKEVLFPVTLADARRRRRRSSWGQWGFW